MVNVCTKFVHLSNLCLVIKVKAGWTTTATLVSLIVTFDLLTSISTGFNKFHAECLYQIKKKEKKEKKKKKKRKKKKEKKKGKKKKKPSNLCLTIIRSRRMLDGPFTSTLLKVPVTLTFNQLTLKSHLHSMAHVGTKF